jgi:hypothetical protein
MESLSFILFILFFKFFFFAVHEASEIVGHGMSSCFFTLLFVSLGLEIICGL